MLKEASVLKKNAMVLLFIREIIFWLQKFLSLIFWLTCCLSIFCLFPIDYIWKYHVGTWQDDFCFFFRIFFYFSPSTFVHCIVISSHMNRQSIRVGSPRISYFLKSIRYFGLMSSTLQCKSCPKCPLLQKIYLYTARTDKFKRKYICGRGNLLFVEKSRNTKLA